MLVRHNGALFEGEPGIYYSEVFDQLFLLEEKKFEMYPVSAKTLTLESAYSYIASNGETINNERIYLGKDLKLFYIGDL